MTATETKKIKEKIINLFLKNVKGRVPNTSTSNQGHDGRGGHWLETQMGVAHNASNTPDIDGFEMKNHTTGKTTFGDWSPKYGIWKGKDKILTRDEFLSIFGAPNIERENRYSWSGKPCPKIGAYNSFGQKLTIDRDETIKVAEYYWQQQLKSFSDKTFPNNVTKVLVEMKKPKSYENVIAEPVIIYWMPISKDNNLKPFSHISVSDLHNENIQTPFKTLGIFSVSLYLRELMNGGVKTVDADMPNVQARMDILNAILE